MNTQPIFQLRDLSQQYDGRTVLHIDHLDIYDGEILALVGPSGAGKSTLLRQLNFLETPATGTVSLDGQVVTPSTALDYRRQVTTVFQTPMLLNRSVAVNVGYGLKIRGYPRHKIRPLVDQMLKQVGLAHLSEANARTLSGGETQRVALARALVVQPKVLLLDEPTANLDPANIKLIETILREVNQTRGTTLVLVTHNIFQAKRLAHRIALLLEGRLVEIADTQTFFEGPKDSRTAAFVRGDMVY